MANLAKNNGENPSKKKSMYNLKLTSEQMDKLEGFLAQEIGRAGKSSMPDMHLMGME